MAANIPVHECANDRRLEREVLRRFAQSINPKINIQYAEKMACADAHLYLAHHPIALVEVTCRKVPWDTYSSVCGRNREKTDTFVREARRIRVPAYLVTRWKGGRVFYLEVSWKTLHYATTWPMKNGKDKEPPDICYFFPSHLFTELPKSVTKVHPTKVP